MDAVSDRRTEMGHASPAVEQIALMIEELPTLLGRFLVGFNELTRIAQAPNMPNHVIWTLGHLSLYHHRSVERILRLEPGPLPEGDFVTADGRAGDAWRFDTESVCFSSTPIADSAIYPTLERGIEIHTAACGRLAASVREVGDELFVRQVEWGTSGPRFSAAILAMRIVHHVGSHAGQILDLRRARGMPRVIN
ncbi:MAG: DinB family protein [Phycisphaerales bacterium]